MTTNVPVAVSIATFEEKETADLAMVAVKQGRKDKLYVLEGAAVISKENSGAIHIHETGDMSAAKGAAIGAAIGGVLGLLGGPAGVVLAAGFGSVAGTVIASGDSGLPDEGLATLGAEMRSGTSALVAVVDREHLEALNSQLEPFGGHLQHLTLSGDVSAQLKAGKGLHLQ